MTTADSPSVTKIQELLIILLRYEPITDLVKLSHVCKDFCYTTKLIIHMWLCKCLTPFIPADNLKPFLRLLKSSKSTIRGSVALAVISPDPRQWFPEDLNIVVPLSRVSQWCRFLATAGFIERPILNNGTGRFTVENAVVILESAHDSILLPILSSPTTAQMNFITYNQIFCPYPALTIKKLSICAYHGDPNHRSNDPKMPTYRQMLGFELKNIRLLLGTSTLEGECRLSCTEINRHFCGFRGIGIFHWAVYSNKADENDNTITDTCLGYEWSLRNPCMNSELMTSSIVPPTLADTSVTSPSSPPSSKQTATLANSVPLFTKSPSWNTEDNLPTLQDLLRNTSADVKLNTIVRKLSITVRSTNFLGKYVLIADGIGRSEQKTFKIKQTTKLGKMLRYFASSYGKELSTFKLSIGDYFCL
ncbi:hypothetical protein ARMGADRAFT_1028338 [Armillaria gallica]|uniref:F-box domain-containing protein n=1 Tax=Armillaria gallica TaxID=47427 RepID=A0A2H3E6E4_ARMGA|nr:hypothetical protein ARMGADRAFT_1028338 [Armillaria gallica]